MSHQIFLFGILPSLICINTVRKRRRRLCFYKCLSVHRGGEVPGQAPPLGRCPPAGTLTHRQAQPSWTGTPRQVHPPGRHTPWQVHPPGRTPWSVTPPGPQCMVGYGQQVGGTHPTGMHTCLSYFPRSNPVNEMFLDLLTSYST